MLKKIFLYSLTTLFLELLVIRWITTELNFLAYLQNSVLVVCLFGFGLGLLLPGRLLTVTNAFLPLLTLTLLVCIPKLKESLHSGMLGLSIFHDFVSWQQLESTSPPIRTIGVGIIALFCVLNLVLLCFVPWGQAIGNCFKDSDSSAIKLNLYGANLAGSLIGILLFGCLSAFCLSPLVWLIVAAILFYISMFPNVKNRTALFLACLLLPASQVVADYFSKSIQTYWTPYQKIELVDHQAGDEYLMLVNNTGYQQIQNNTASYLDQHINEIIPRSRGFSQYDVPSLLKPNAKKILIVGAGTGNDVAGALRNSIAEITAVEIDPVILDVGKRLHPEAPYQSPRVQIVLDDARAFFERSKEKYDLIVFGLLDSHTTPNLGSARLDHFVYTRESLKAAANLLNKDGIITVIFAPQRDYIKTRLYKALQTTFNQEPLVAEFKTDAQGWGGWIFIGGGLSAVESALNANDKLNSYFSEIKVDPKKIEMPDVAETFDDWPYLYLRNPTIPKVFYLFLSVISAVFIYRWKRESAELIFSLKPSRLELIALLLGAGFALLETYGVSRAAILFGSTWVPNTVVISAILIMAFLANICVIKLKNLKTSYATLALPIIALLSALFPLNTLLMMGVVSRYSIALMVFGLPLFFSGIYFSKILSNSDEPRTILAWNLFGSVLGSLLHYLSYQFGFRAIGVLGAGLYLIASCMGYAHGKPIVELSRE